MTPDNPLIENGKMELLAFEGTLTKRERFAMAAMQGFCANSDYAGMKYSALADMARKQADDMIEALKSIPEPQ